MYNITAENQSLITDMVGQSVAAVDANAFSLILQLSAGTQLMCESALSINSQTYLLPNGLTSAEQAELAQQLHHQTITAVEIIQNRSLQLTLSNNSILAIDGLNDHYECFQITRNKQTLIV